jgi:hypothetical protein
VVADQATGQLVSVFDKGRDGKPGRIVVFGKVDPSSVQAGGGTEVVRFNSLPADEQNQILASLPVMDNRDPAALTAKLVAMEERVMKAKLAKIGQQGFKVDTENGQIFFETAGWGLGTLLGGGKGLQVLKMGEDANGEVVAYGRMLINDSQGGLTPAGPEVFFSSVASAFSGAVLFEAARLTGVKVGPAVIPAGSYVVAVGRGQEASVTVLGPDQKPLPGLTDVRVPVGVVTGAVNELKIQSPARRGFDAMETLGRIGQKLKQFLLESPATSSGGRR